MLHLFLLLSVGEVIVLIIVFVALLNHKLLLGVLRVLITVLVLVCLVILITNLLLNNKLLQLSHLITV